ncbi:MAG: T9SS type A sorting domain-containing protein, partial [Cytophagales bacterium]|nr:T9SS type A sorting domain-containing protein [Cytophagales bacterium]
NTSPYGGLPFTVLSNVLTLKSFSVMSRSGFTGNFDVIIQNSSGATVFQKTYNLTASGVNYVVNINTDFFAGNYTITLTSPTVQWRGGTWAGGTNAGQISLPTFGFNGTYGLANLVYDYKNLSYSPTCALRTLVTPSCVTPTPIQLLNFSGEYKLSKVYLQLSTISEADNDFIEIQRSADGIHFTTFTTIKGNGNTSRVSEYATIDHSPYPKTSFYRLVQHDYNGETYTSKIISVNSEVTGASIFVHPNPSTNTFHISLENSVGGELTVFDMVGKVVYSKVLSQGENAIDLGADFDKGAYIVRFSNENTIASELVIKE